jgi:hypothetical protein
MKKNKFILSFVTILGLGMSSCLEDTGYLDIVNGENKQTVVSIGQNGYGFTTRSVEFSDAPVEATVSVNVVAPGEVKTPTTVTFEVDPSLVDQYNIEHAGDEDFVAFTVLPDSTYSLPSASITVPAGTMDMDFPFQIITSKIDLSQKYMLPLVIASADNGAVVASNLNAALISVVVKNAYEGDYHATGVFHHPVAGDRDIDEDKYLSTVDGTTVLAPLGDLGGAGYRMKLRINADNTVTITPDGATPNIDQHWGANFYDPDTKSFHLHYSYNVAAPRIIEETIARVE